MAIKPDAWWTALEQQNAANAFYSGEYGGDSAHSPSPTFGSSSRRDSRDFGSSPSYSSSSHRSRGDAGISSPGSDTRPYPSDDDTYFSTFDRDSFEGAEEHVQYVLRTVSHLRQRDGKVEVVLLVPPSGESDDVTGAGRVELAVDLKDLAEALYVSELKWFEVSSLHTRPAV